MILGDPNDRPRPLAWERVLICGKTQSGKSELVSFWVPDAARHTPTLIIDPKQARAMRRLSDFRLPTVRPVLPSPEWYESRYADLGRFPVLRYCPDSAKKPGRDDDLDALFGQVLVRGNMLVVSDETLTWANEGSYPQNAKAIDQLGAEKKIGHWKINQRSMRIPPFFLSSADVVVSFWMGNGQDRKRLSEVGVDFEPVKSLEPYEYAWYHTGKARDITIYPPIPLKKGA